MDRVLGAHLAAIELDGAIGDDLVDVHVGLSSASGLPDDERKVVVELTVNDLLGSASDQISGFPAEDSEARVASCGGQLEDSECADELSWHAFVANPEVGERAGGLRAPIAVDRYLDLAHAVPFHSSCHVSSPS